MMDAIFDAMVRMAVVVEHLARVAPIAWRERLVPLREDVRLRIRRRVLWGCVSSSCASSDDGGHAPQSPRAARAGWRGRSGPGLGG